MIFRILGIAIVIFGLALPGAKVSRSVRYKNAKNFWKHALWMLIGLVIAAFGLWVMHFGE